jgi:hypothetical protein
MIVGAGLVLLTWALAVILVILLGLWPATLGARDRGDAVRPSLWWGLSIAVVIVLALSLLMPLGSPAALITMVLLAVIAGVAGVHRWRGLPRRTGSSKQSWARWLVLGALSASVVYLAVAALGPVTNYDTGLYHLGALRYQEEFGLVPGIANLYFPLGYGNSVIPLSSFLGSTPWQENGFRLFNGFLLVLLAIELVLRVRRRRWTPGTWLLIAALGFVWIPMVALSDYWVTSPTSDSSILILTSVAVAYLADAAVAPMRRRAADLAVALVVSWVLVSMRPTMAVFALVTLAVAAILTLRDRRAGRPDGSMPPLLIGIVLMGVTVAVLQVARDRILSGWLQYPLSVFAFDVPWRAADPVGYRTATLGAARDPEDLWAAAESWNWIPGWLSRAPTQWEFWLAILIATGSALLALLARHYRAPWRPRALLLVLVPSLLATAAWFLASPPAFRFIWGPLFTLVALPGAFAAGGLTRVKPSGESIRALAGPAVAMPAVALLGVVAFSAVARLDIGSITQEQQFSVGPIAMPYTVTAIPTPPSSAGTLESGLEVLFPIESDQCWAVYPLCTAQIEPTVRMIGPTIGDGFAR